MSSIITLSLDVRVTDPAALYRRALAYLIEQGGASTAEDFAHLIGTEAEPNAGACLAMLLDRSEHLDGAEIQNHEYSEVADDEGGAFSWLA